MRTATRVSPLSKVLITGAGGYIGGRLVETLHQRGCEVRAVVREPAPRLSVPQTICDLARPDDEVLAAACQGIDTLVHLAGENELVAARQPAQALAATVVATEAVSEACAAAGIGRLVYMSTVHVYGARIVPGATLTEDMRPEPRSAYAISRLASEHVAASLARGAYELVIMRLTNSVGAPDDPSVDRWSLVANDLCRQGSLTHHLELKSSGLQWRDFVPLSSVCAAIADISLAPAGVIEPGTYNLGTGRPITVRALAQMIQDAFERLTGHCPELHAPDPEGMAPEPYHVSVDRAASQGLVLDAALEAAVLETARFCLDHREELR